jgi:hypothetical protein
MKRVIYKFEIMGAIEKAMEKEGATEGAFTIDMPQGAKILCVQVQRSEPCIWAICDRKAKLGPRRFFLAGTGLDFDEGSGSSQPLAYVGTFQVHGGELVFHLFDAGC